MSSFKTFIVIIDKIFIFKLHIYHASQLPKKIQMPNVQKSKHVLVVWKGHSLYTTKEITFKFQKWQRKQVEAIPLDFTSNI
jgi:hypothetical protein